MRETQGNKKIRRYLKDLNKNKEFKADLKKITIEKNKKKREMLLLNLSNKYAVDWTLLQVISDENKASFEEYIDMCDIGYTFDEDMGDILLKSKLERKMHRNAYPVSIDIHQFASERSIIDFIKKNWEEIEEYLTFSANKKSSVKTRVNSKRDEWIYENKNKFKGKPSDFLEAIKNKFRNTTSFDYQTIYKIISKEKKRRSQFIYKKRITPEDDID